MDRLLRDMGRKERGEEMTTSEMFIRGGQDVPVRMDRESTLDRLNCEIVLWQQKMLSTTH